MNHAAAIEMNHPEEQQYNITDSDIELMYKCAATAIYIIVAYMVYYHYNLLIKILSFIFLTIFILYHMAHLFKILDTIFR